MKYNRSLDYMLSAAVKLHEGKDALAAKLLMKATLSSDFPHAVRVLEASCSQAHAAKTSAQKRVMAAKIRAEADDAELEGLVGDLDALESEHEAEEEVMSAMDECADEDEHYARVRTSARRRVRSSHEPEGLPGDALDEALEIQDEEIKREASASAARMARMLASMRRK